jgi:hypothetical protein
MRVTVSVGGAASGVSLNYSSPLMAILKSVSGNDLWLANQRRNRERETRRERGQRTAA